MVPPEFEKPRVTEIQVRMDCNGCVQKIRKALNGIQGICAVYPDIAQQKLTVVGWADPERIVKAIRKTRKVATICSHSEPAETAAAQPAEQPPEAEGGGPPPSEAAGNPNPPPSEAPPAEAPAAATQPQPQPEASPPAEPLKDQPPPENPQPEPSPPPAATTDHANASNQQPPQPSGPKDVGEVHVICHHPPDYGHRYGYGYGYVHNYGGPWNRQYPNSQGNFCPEPLSRHPNSQVFHHDQPPQPAFVTHSYNTYKPSPYVTEYHEYAHSPPQYTHYSRIDHYNEDYHSNYSSGSSSSNNGNGNGNGNITSIFSDENPNACTIM